jgi:uncharacterized protein YkwD
MRYVTVLALLSLMSCLASAQVFTTSYNPLSPNPLENNLTFESNQARRRNGVEPLAYDQALALAARQHAREMSQLNYFAHQSPNPENATVRDRVKRAGSAALAVGENLALIGNSATLAQDAVQGWLDSPGHRANLLNPDFTHVGHGLATSSDGSVYIVQVLAIQNYVISQVEISQGLLDVQTLDVTVIVQQEGDYALFQSNQFDQAHSTAAGTYRYQMHLTQAEPVHVRLGFKGEGNGYIGQDGGWYDPSNKRYRADPAIAGRQAYIQNVSGLQVKQPRATIRIDFASEIGQNLAVIVDETFLREANAGPNTLIFDVIGPGSHEIIIGEIRGNQVAHLYQLEFDANRGILRPK